MIVTLKQAVRLPPGPKGKDYPRGNHDLPEEATSHPFFLKLVAAGLALDGEKAKIVSSLSEQQRSQKLVDKVAAQAQAKANAAAKAKASVPPVPSQGQPVQPAAPAGALDAPVAPPADSGLSEPSPADVVPPVKSEEEQLAELQAEEDAKAKAKADAEAIAAAKAKAASKNKQNK